MFKNYQKQNIWLTITVLVDQLPERLFDTRFLF